MEPIIINNIDITKLNEKDFISLGLTLMKNSIKKIFDINAKEHDDWFRYSDELKRRNPHIEIDSNEIQ